MVRIWAKLIKGEKILKDCIYEKEEAFDIQHFAFYLMEICEKMDIEMPILLSKHVKYYYLFNTTKFLPEDFIYDVKWDSFVLENAVL